MTTALTLITDALAELMYLDNEGAPNAADAATGLRYLNRMLSAFTADGMLVVYPAGVTTWRGDWAVSTSYAVNDGVMVGGRAYKCLVAHTSTRDDKPIVGLNQATYWSQSLPGTLALSDTITPFDASDEESLVYLLAERLAGPFSIPVSDMLARHAYVARNRLTARYMPIADVEFDAALTRTPARRWPSTGASDI